MSDCYDVTKNIELLIQQYKQSTNIKSLIGGLLELGQQQFFDVLCEFSDKANAIDNASEWFLDRIGDNFGYPRPSIIVDNELINIDDDLYKVLLRLWVFNIFYDGTTADVNKALTQSFGKGYLYDPGVMKCEVWIFGQSSDTIVALIKSGVVPKPGGVRYLYYRSIKNPKKTFGFAGSGCNTFNQGSFANEFLGD